MKRQTNIKYWWLIWSHSGKKTDSIPINVETAKIIKKCVQKPQKKNVKIITARFKCYGWVKGV